MKCSLRFSALLITVVAGIAMIQGQNRVTFSVSKERLVRADLMVVSLLLIVEGDQLEDATLALSNEVDWVLEQLSEYGDLSFELYQVQTSPKYDKAGKRSGWEIRQPGKINWPATRKIDDLLILLEPRVNITATVFELSEQMLAAELEGLTVAVLEEVEEQAEVIAATLSASGYQIEEINIDRRGRSPAAFADPGGQAISLGNSFPPPADFVKGQQLLGLTAKAAIIINRAKS